MKEEIPVYDVLNFREAKELLAADDAYLKRMMEITIELNGLAEKAGSLMKEYITTYQRITAPARVRPKEDGP